MTVRVRLDRVLARRRMSLAELADRLLAADGVDHVDCGPGDLLTYEPFEAVEEG